jgi:hypothetical protein
VNEEEEVINPILTRRGKDPVLVMKVQTEEADQYHESRAAGGEP